MSDLMKELMAEISRVNEMEDEIERTVKLQREAVNAKRREKAQDIALTLGNFCEALIEADAITEKYHPFYVLPGVRYEERPESFREVVIIFYTDQIYVGKYSPDSGKCSKLESFRHVIGHLAITKAMITLLDAWNPEMELRVEEACVKHIKETLQSRMEAMHEALQKSNAEYAKYVM